MHTTDRVVNSKHSAAFYGLLSVHLCLGYTVWQKNLEIASIKRWCTAYKQGARSGCKITHINGTAIYSWNDYVRYAKSKTVFSMKLKFKTREQYERAVVRRKQSLGLVAFGQLRDAFWLSL